MISQQFEIWTFEVIEENNDSFAVDMFSISHVIFDKVDTQPSFPSVERRARKGCVDCERKSETKLLQVCVTSLSEFSSIFSNTFVNKLLPTK